MPKNDELSKHTLLLRSGDYERLRELFPEVGAAVIIRKLVSRFLDKDVQESKLKVEIKL